MEKNKFHSLMLKPFLSFPYFDEEEFWGIDSSEKSGLSLSEDDKNIYVEAHLPGLDTEDIDIFFEKGDLLIKGSKKEEKKDEKKKYYKKAMSSFCYRASLPSSCDETKEPEASYKNGVLKIIFGKKEKSVGKAKKISIKKS